MAEIGVAQVIAAGLSSMDGHGLGLDLCGFVLSDGAQRHMEILRGWMYEIWFHDGSSVKGRVGDLVSTDVMDFRFMLEVGGRPHEVRLDDVACIASSMAVVRVGAMPVMKRVSSCMECVLDEWEEL